MKIEANSPQEYIEKLTEDRKKSFSNLRKTILDNLPEEFEETMSYAMIGYVVPKSIYPGGYHCDPNLPLPFINIASQKKYIALYHSGIYADPDLLQWFKSEFPKYSKTKLDMGKSCIRFKKIDQIPYELIGELVKKLNCSEWIELYEKSIKSKIK